MDPEGKGPGEARLPKTGVTRANLLVLLAGAVLLLAGLAALRGPAPANALPAYIHGAAQSCDACHHEGSFQACTACHAETVKPNTKCTACHAGKTTAGSTCWACHAPGAPQPEPIDANCRTCHSANPHLGSSPTCTTCHSTAPTPHHDDVDQRRPGTCTDCHRHEKAQSHDGQPCTACHATDVHPSLPPVPAACNACHPAERFNGRGACTACHAGTAAFSGQVDNDIHDADLPDGPISARSCTACHTGKQKHAGRIACLDCHAEATAFHHGTASSPGFKECTDCHGVRPQHGAGLACTACHTGAQHQAAPSRPPATVCSQCHAPATYGQRECFTCHRTPVYHAPHQVGACSSCHGTGRAAHAGRFGCTDCHTNIRRGHHLTRVRIPSCTTKGCHAQQKHVGSVACTTCHGSRAPHDRSPLNLPADTWSVCGRCHAFVPTALAAGVPACTECHDTAQHKADYRVQTCTACHADKTRHAAKVDCRSCHQTLGEGHHRAGRVTARACSECHVGVEIHAVSTTKGAAFTCGTCHEGSVHGTLGRPAPDFCLTCHAEAKSHAGGNACTECHWPAAHAGRPDAGKFGGFTPLAVNLPGGGPPPTGPSGPPRPRFTNTGVQLPALAALGLLLAGAGLALRRRRAR